MHHTESRLLDGSSSREEDASSASCSSRQLTARSNTIAGIQQLVQAGLYLHLNEDMLPKKVNLGHFLSYLGSEVETPLSVGGFPSVDSATFCDSLLSATLIPAIHHSSDLLNLNSCQWLLEESRRKRSPILPLQISMLQTPNATQAYPCFLSRYYLRFVIPRAQLQYRLIS